MSNVVCFDLEGPLSPQDNAYELMGLIDEGYSIFEVLSRYDDILTLEGRAGYEPGDTLSLIVPFLIQHNISEENILDVSKKAKITGGARELVQQLSGDWSEYVISTSYMQHALNISRQVGIPEDNVYATEFPLDEFYDKVDQKDLNLVEDIEESILNELSGESDAEIKETLDEFYSKISETSLGVLSEVKVVGGERKLDFLNDVIRRECKRLSEVVVVGDSITDLKMLDAVKKNNGIAVVFNGNKYALSHGNIGLACSSIQPLLIILEAFVEGGTEKVFDVVSNLRDKKEQYNNFLEPYLSSLLSLSEEEERKLIKIHSKARKYVRGEAGKLG